MDIIKKAYLAIIGENIEIYYAPTKDLETFTTTERDSLKGISRFPAKNLQRHDEDLLKTTDLMPILLSQVKCLNNSTKSQDNRDAKESLFTFERKFMTENLSRKIEELFSNSKLDSEGRISLEENQSNMRKLINQELSADKTRPVGEHDVDEIFKGLNRNSACSISKEELIRKLEQQSAIRLETEM